MSAADKPRLVPTQENSSPLFPSGALPAAVSNAKPVTSPAEKGKLPPWIRGTINTPTGEVYRVSSQMTWRDHMGSFRARISRFRMKYRIDPGLYAIGSPDDSSPVLVSANYKLSFDHLRASLRGIDAWILVLETAGINVWCAAGKGTFGTGELVRRIETTGLQHIVNKKRIIVPQLGAPGVSAPMVKKATGFTVRFGPVMARDIKTYLDKGMKKDDTMKEVPFTLYDRFVLVPMEMNPAVKNYLPLSLGLMAFFGLTAEGILFKKAVTEGGIFILSLGGALLTGAALVPLLLPLLPFRSFALKGAFAGIILAAVSGALGALDGVNHFLAAALILIIPVVSSYLALMFTGATTFTNISGVKKEMRYAVPVYIGIAVLSSILLLLFKITTWGT